MTHAIVAAIVLTMSGPALLHASVQYYATRSSFNAAQSGLPVEGFNNANVGPGALLLQQSPLSTETNGSVFSLGSILPGLSISNSGEGMPGLIVYGDGALSGGTKSVGTNWFGDKLILTFSPGVPAVAMDVFAATSPGQALAGTFSVEAHNGSNLIGSTTVSEAKGTFGFVGISSTTPITSVAILYTTNDATTFVDNIAFGSALLGTPALLTNGVVPIFSSGNSIQPGSWISIFGSNFTAAPVTWHNDFPIVLGGTSVTINNKPAYLWYVGPTQINLQAPDDTYTGPVTVVVHTPVGSAQSTVSLAEIAPSFSLLDDRHVAGLILRSDGSGTWGGGKYDVLGPTGDSLGYRTVAAKPGDILALFGVGFGPTNPAVPAGASYAGGAQTTIPVQLRIGNRSVSPTFAGVSAAGLYQINVVVPSGLGTGDVMLTAVVGGTQTRSGVVISLQ